jgi:hypothetical protein
VLKNRVQRALENRVQRNIYELKREGKERLKKTA